MPVVLNRQEPTQSKPATKPAAAGVRSVPHSKIAIGAVGALLLLVAIWFLFLRPGGAEPPPQTPSSNLAGTAKAVKEPEAQDGAALRGLGSKQNGNVGGDTLDHEDTPPNLQPGARTPVEAAQGGKDARGTD